jgi:hypothetical protein
METQPMPTAFRSPLMPAFSLAERLDGLAGLLYYVSDFGYAAAEAGGMTRSIGAHVRQCVDHLLALLDRPTGQAMTYDDRGRQPASAPEVERDRRLAITMLRGLAFRVRDMAPRTADVPVAVEAPLDRPGTRIRLQSSLGRELVFVLHLVSAAERVTEARCAS